MAIKELKDYMFENYYSQIGFTKENSCYWWNIKRKQILLATLFEKIFDASHAKKYYKSFSKSNKEFANHWLKKNYSATKN